jgi:hypothetical protein
LVGSLLPDTATELADDQEADARKGRDARGIDAGEERRDGLGCGPDRHWLADGTAFLTPEAFRAFGLPDQMQP